MSLHRRNFIRNTSLAALGSGVLSAVPLELLASVRKNTAASDTINVGLIGCRGMGWTNLTAMLKAAGVRCTALCDVDSNVLNQRKAELEKIGISPTLFTDYRKLLESKDVDAVIIATPDHWHCLQMIDACAAGKDVLVEKPVANSIREAQLMVAAAAKYNRVVQVNQWQRSQQHFKDAIAYVHSGQLGKVSMTKTWMFRANTTPLTPVPDAPVPAGVDYNAWLGPARKRPFNKNRFHFDFRWFWDYAGGLMTDWGVHLIDMVLLGMKAEVPRTVVAVGGKHVFPTDARETPDTQSVIYDYGDFLMTWEHSMASGSGNFGHGHGIAFFGEHGTLVLTRSGWEVKPSGDKKEKKIEVVSWQPRKDNGPEKHTANFIEVVRSRDFSQLNCPIEAGARVAINSHMGNIAQRTGKKITWDAAKGAFTSSKANKLITPDYHNGWKLPKLT